MPLNAPASRPASVIGILDELTINRIAAGEVVDRPASAVKELVENAIDAGARRIRVRLEGGGLDLVAVEDDGSGMTLHDLRLCWMRHATSKLVKLEDLMHVGTYGFRGEALSSLAAVAELRIDTRHHLEEDGHAIVVRDGQLRSEAPSAWVRGTRIEVRGLFAGFPCVASSWARLPARPRGCSPPWCGRPWRAPTWSSGSITVPANSWWLPPRTARPACGACWDNWPKV